MMEFLEKNSYYVVLIIMLIIWAGIFAYMMSMDKRVKKLEQK
jgi:CcmD family protein